MESESVRFFDGHKYMWDCAVCGTKEEAEAKKTKYENGNFEVRIVEEENKFFLYTRRVVTEVKVEGAPPV
ncbi:hypothetical protein IBX73_04125 [candidate division WOR-3 bacterium]|nr:hypothetical protein [candidate division WOR-3 bacterium]